MYQYKGLDDTIAAIATAAGAGGVAIVRLSGKSSVEVLSKVFAAKSAGEPQGWKANVMHYGWVKDLAGKQVDESLAVVMRAPHSFTAEDVAEIHTHGGAIAARVALELCLKNGARLAEPGEFTRRAFLNGRIDLTQAEAVQDMVTARTESALRAASHQLGGELSAELNAIRDRLMTVYAGLEAFLNFPDDDTDQGQFAGAADNIVAIQKRLDRLLATADGGMVLRQGIRMVICGKPNAGKSSLLNALLKHQRAIVTDMAGTTRDTLEESANIKGIPVNLVDTAGILEPRNKIEEEAVRRSHASIAAADMVILVLDRSRPLEAADLDLLSRTSSARAVIVLNKCDLPTGGVNNIAALASGRPVVEVSALSRAGLDQLEELLASLAVKGGVPDANGLLVTNVRHVEALGLAAQALRQSLEALRNKAPLEIVSEGIKAAVNRLDAITGRNIDTDAIDRIFAGFCIGK
ncbi:MAG: tRNA uridine-5-carboxymethylaminomethyl(34) synthesis GTPase MnmE [Candidatus Omnitrophota bacterium]